MNYEQMNKQELRAECRKAGIKYGKMNNTQMRTALKVEEERAVMKTAAPEIVAHEMGLDQAKANGNGHGGKFAWKQGDIQPVVRNGIRQPGKGKCRDVWDELDQVAKTFGGVDRVGVIRAREMAAKRGWNVNNTVTEFYQWRKFNGVFGRVKKEA